MSDDKRSDRLRNNNGCEGGGIKLSFNVILLCNICGRIECTHVLPVTCFEFLLLERIIYIKNVKRRYLHGRIARTFRTFIFILHRHRLI